MVEKLQPLFPDIIFQPEDEICNYCYNKLLNRIDEKELSPSQSEVSSAVPAVYSDLSLLSSNSSDKSFVPKTSPEDIENLNAELQIQSSTVSPLKNVNEVDVRWRVNYVSRKRKEIAEIQDSRLLCKMKKLYDIAENVELKFPISEISSCQLCVNWFENFSSSLEKCTSYTEKIRLLSAAHICQMQKNLIFSKWPHVTDHMIRRARSIVTEKGNYSIPDPYSGHPIDENVRKVALEYYLNDDLNCSTQTPNKNDSINVYENGAKVVKIKRYMKHSIHETYQMFKQDHSDLKIGY